MRSSTRISSSRRSSPIAPLDSTISRARSEIYGVGATGASSSSTSSGRATAARPQRDAAVLERGADEQQVGRHVVAEQRFRERLGVDVDVLLGAGVALDRAQVA